MVTVTAAEVVELLAASVATAVSVWVPFVTLLVFQVIEYGLVVSVASCFVPSRKKVTLATPDAAPEPVPRSVALALTVTLVPWVKLDPEAGARIEAVGGAASLRTCWGLTGSWLPGPAGESNFMGRD